MDFVTKGIVFHAPKPLKVIEESEDKEYTEANGYHATEHVVIEGSNMITGGVFQDLGGISLGTSGLIFIYDGLLVEVVQVKPSMTDLKRRLKEICS